MLNCLRTRFKKEAAYNFYVWENGGYVEEDVERGSNGELISTVLNRKGGAISAQRPSSLDAPQLHVIREDGIQILTLDVPGKPPRSEGT